MKYAHRIVVSELQILVDLWQSFTYIVSIYIIKYDVLPSALDFATNWVALWSLVPGINQFPLTC